MPATVFDDAALRQAVDALVQQPAVRSDPAEAPKKKGVGIAPYAALAGGNAADVLSTWYALSHGAHEGNGLLPSGMAGIAATKAALTLPELLAMHFIGKTHPTIAKILGFAGGGVGAAMATHNLRLGKP